MTKKPDQVDVHVGSRIRMRRMMSSMSQEKLGNAIGLSFQQVQKYEKGMNRVGASRLQQIAKVLNVTPAFFFDGAPGLNVVGADGIDLSGSPEIVGRFFSLPYAQELAEYYVAIAHNLNRRKLVDIAEMFASLPAKKTDVAA